MPLMSDLSSLAKKAVKKMPKLSASSGLHHDSRSEGNDTVQMVSRVRDEARMIHGPIEREALDAVQAYFGNQWDYQQYSGDAMDAQRGTVAFQSVISGGSDGMDDLVRPVLNRTQNAILSNTEARTARPVQIRFQPQETGDDAEHWLTKRGANSLILLRETKIGEMQQAIIAQGQMSPADTGAPPPPPINETEAMDEIDAVYPDIAGFMDDEYGPSRALSDSQVDKVNALIDQGLFTREDMQKIDDDATADEIQKIATTLNRDANLDGKYLRAANYSTACGYCFLRFTYMMRGARKHRISLETMPIKAVWIDPHHDDIADCDYAGEDRVVSLERAKVMFPELGDDLLESAANSGSVDAHDTGVNTAGYQRDMLQITTTWHRHHKVPASIDQALSEEWVERTEVKVKDVDEEGTEKEVELLDEETGRPKVTYRLTEHGAKHVGKSASAGDIVEPQDERDHGTNWPDTEGLRQVVTIGGLDFPVQDVRCPYWDIPLILFINVPRIDGSPLGQGDAKRLEDIQREINRVAAIIINNQRYAQSPTMVLPQTVHDILSGTGLSLFNEPGGYSVMPDHAFYNVLQNGGFQSMVVQPPELSVSAMNLLQMLIAEHDTLSGNVGVRQGRAPSSGSSGVAIAQLQEHATGTLALKARMDEHAMTRYGRLLQHAIVSWMPETEWTKISSRYALPALRRIIERAGYSDFNVQVSVAAGRGIAKQLDRAQTMEMYNSGLLPLEDTLAELEVDDPAGKARRILEQRGAQQPSGQVGASISLDQYAPGPR